MEIAFEWDDAKADLNLAKHRMSFERVTEGFSDPNLATVNATREEPARSG